MTILIYKLSGLFKILIKQELFLVAHLKRTYYNSIILSKISKFLMWKNYNYILLEKKII